MNILIVEDEKLSARKLQGMLQKIIPHASILQVTDSVADTLDYLNSCPPIDLGFFDIQLSDGLSFEIFDQRDVDFPVIFTTAFNEYAIKAFKVNSIDYLLKPVNETELTTAVDKFKKGYARTPAALDSEVVAKALSMLTNNYKNRFVVKVGEHIRLIPVEEIALFFSSEKYTFMRTVGDRDYGIDFTLEQVMDTVNPNQFFRVSRKHIIALSAIKDIIAYSGSRLKVKLNVSTEEDVLVSRDKVADFKA
ncbi:MAG: DNA-binding response regulator, partial [Bacteroidia bacterium]